jgi:hypothetical protein
MKRNKLAKRKIRSTIKSRLSRKGEKTKMKLSEFFRNSPLGGIELSRDKSLPRDNQQKKSALEIIESLNVDAQPDWSENVENYLQAQKRAHR